MAQYTVQDPQGNNRIIEGPDGASDEEVIAQAQKLFGQSGGMEAIGNAITAFRKNHAAAQLPTLNTQATDLSQRYGNDPFQADINYLSDPKANVVSNAPGEFVNNSNMVAGGYATPSLITGLGSAVANKVGSLIDLLKAPKAAEGFKALETPMEAGNTIAIARDTEEAARKAISNANYAKIPKDISIPVNKATEIADTVANEAGKVDPAFQPSKSFMAKVEALQNMDKTDIGAIQTMQSHFKDIARNGEGIEKVYAAQLSDALQQDLEAFDKTSILPSSPEAGVVLNDGKMSDNVIRGKWVKAADEQGAFEGNDALLNRASKYWDGTAQPLTNSDIPQNMKIANSYYRDMSGLNNSDLARALDKAHLEAKTNVIFKSKSIDDVNTARALLGDKGYEAAAGQFYNKLVNSPDLTTALSKYSPEFLNAAIGSQRLQALQKLAQFKELVKTVGTATKIGAYGLGAGAAYKTFQAFRRPSGG